MSDREAAVLHSLRQLAEWFDNPNTSPELVVNGKTPGMLLRAIADRLEDLCLHRRTQQ